MSSLSDADTETLRSIGHDTITNIVALCVEAVLWTVYLVLIIIAGNILLRKRRSNMSLLMFLLVLAMFLMDTSLCIIDVNNAIKELSWTLTSHLDMSLQDRYSLIANLPWPVESAIYAFMSNLGDIIVIWRVHAFYSQGNDRWWLVIPLALLVGSFVTSGLITFCVVKLIEDPALGDFVNPPFCKNVQLSSYIAAMTTTGVATILISYKTWQYRRTIGRHLRGTNKMTKCERVMAILIESGILYFLFFLEAVITDSGNIEREENATPTGAFAATVWTYMTSHILGIYPVLVIILVHSQRSYIETTTKWTTANFHPASNFTSTSNSRQYWTNSRGGVSPLTAGQRTQPIEVSVHELRQVHGAASFKSIDETVGDDTAINTKLSESKVSDTIAI